MKASLKSAGSTGALPLRMWIIEAAGAASSLCVEEVTVASSCVSRRDMPAAFAEGLKRAYANQASS